LIDLESLKRLGLHPFFVALFEGITVGTAASA
jgi:hypothetical protein